jgi:hypothetical protein
MDTKRIIGVAMLLAACLFGILISTAFFSTQEADEIPYWWKGLRITGTVLEVSNSSIKISVEGSKEMAFDINSLTKVALQGHSQVEKGALVRITYKPIKGNAPSIARWIKELPQQAGKKQGGGAISSPGATPSEAVPPSSGTPVPEGTKKPSDV